MAVHVCVCVCVYAGLPVACQVLAIPDSVVETACYSVSVFVSSSP